MEMMISNSNDEMMENQYSLVLPPDRMGWTQNFAKILLVHGKKNEDCKEEYRSIDVPSPDVLYRKNRLYLPSPRKENKRLHVLGERMKFGTNLERMPRHGSVELIELTRPAIRCEMPILEAILE